MKDDSFRIIEAQKILTSVKNTHRTLEEREQCAVTLAALILEESRHRHTKKERKKQAELAKMMRDPRGKAFMTAMSDQCFRGKRSSRIADQMVFLLHKFGIPKFLTWWKRLSLWMFRRFGNRLPRLFVPVMHYFLRKEMRAVIIPGEPRKLAQHINKRSKEGVRLNINYLGEAILGEEEAQRRSALYKETLKRSDVTYVSIKVSTIYSQISLLAYDTTRTQIAHRLRELYQTAKAHPYTDDSGRSCYKFVNLDMEEYRDVHLTKDVFMQVLSEEAFHDLSAGIVLQAYLPDAYSLLQELTEWAIERRKQGGAPIKIRIVKGANMAMEQCEASTENWEQAPYKHKVESDANYKRMVLYALQKRRAKAVHIGIASHNLFDIAFALLLRAEHGLENEVSFEMLEGMASHTRRVVHRLAGNILLYCAVAKKSDFEHAIAYLIRRLDENTGVENFLAQSFDLHKDSAEWSHQVAIFSEACRRIEEVEHKPNRTQNRFARPKPLALEAPFDNEANTDFSSPHSRHWLEAIIRKYREASFESIPLVINGETICAPSEKGYDPSKSEKALYTFTIAPWERLDQALDAAVAARTEWAKTSIEKRCSFASRAAQLLREARGALIGVMIADGGKNPAEADVEISEAIDFCEYYLRSLKELHSHSDLAFAPKGTVLVTPPWNFPCAIPIGGVVAALLCGNTVLFKPARETTLIGWHIVQLLWEAGFPKSALQFIQCNDTPEGSKLIKDPRVTNGILTGATATARLFMQMRPDFDLTAETGGKNAMIITALADKDLAIKSLIQSAFGHSGQKCSAASLAIIEKELYNDPHFLAQLKDAAQSLHVGSAWDPANKVTPLIRAPGKELTWALTQLDEGERWLLEPKQDPDNPHLYSPGIKIGAAEGSYSHQTEFFGPVLSLMCADNLMEAIRIANATPYGLTSGIQTLDEREQRLWSKWIIAGNCYINRGITGAVVRRQSFGGTKRSSFGPGAKTGGPNYLAQYMHIEQRGVPKQKRKVNDFVNNLSSALEHIELSQEELGLWYASTASYAYWQNRFKRADDPSQILGQDNYFKYTERHHMYVRITKETKPLDYLRIFAAALTTGTPLNISWEAIPKAVSWHTLLPFFTIKEESEEECIESIRNGSVERLRMTTKPSQQLRNAAADALCFIDYAPVLANGRLELLHYIREETLSIDYHRYGNLGMRDGEKRRPIK